MNGLCVDHHLTVQTRFLHRYLLISSTTIFFSIQNGVVKAMALLWLRFRNIRVRIEQNTRAVSYTHLTLPTTPYV